MIGASPGVNHVRLTLDAGGREADIHPMYDLMSDSEHVERATAIQWNYTGEELGILHYVEGDADAFAAVVAEVPQVVEFELTRAGEGAFYAYVSDELTPEAALLFEVLAAGTAVVVPPVVYEPDGTVSFSVFGPAGDVETAIDLVPDFVDVDVREVGGMAGLPGLHETVLSERQRRAVRAGLELGYYDVPRTASHEDVATAIDCAPSTAAEHLRKAESKLLHSVLGAP
jgi:hypothetical protein